MSAHGDWQPPEVLEARPVDGAYVRVTPLTSAHYADLYAATCAEGDEALWTYRAVERPTSLAELWMHLAEVAANDVAFAIVPAEGPGAGRAAGIASYQRIKPAHGVAEVGGILLGAGLQRTRAATEALHLLLRGAFDAGYRRVEWKCDTRNAASRAAALRLGLLHEGHFRQHMMLKGRNRDTDWFALTDVDWPEVRGRHEAWLAPANFDVDGTQREPLAR